MKRVGQDGTLPKTLLCEYDLPMDYPPQPSRLSALFLRSIALALILYQFRLLAQDLADTPVFAAALVIAFTAPWFLFRKKVRPIPGLCILALIPWTARFFIAFPRIFFADTAVLLDSLLLNLDRNNLVSLIPFYWAGCSTYFAARSRTFLQADIIMADALLVVIFSIAPTSEISAYRWPVLMILAFILILFLQMLALILSAPPEFKVRRKEKIGAAAAHCILMILGGFLFLRPFQERAVEQGGGLLEPNLFSFDFSQFLHLESEISTKDDLVFIVKKDPEDRHVLLRRYVLSGYNPMQGFFRHETVDEKTHPQGLPEKKTPLPHRESNRSYRVVEQEYYLVNFDASAFIGMHEPVLITPFENWDASSFSAAYAVQSHTSEALSYELFDAGQSPPNPQNLGLSPEWFDLYTDYGKDERITALARKITEGKTNYADKVREIYTYLKTGAYRYSLKPGIAPDGDQLGYFLFQSKKGYCSYFAFSMALLLRSLGIPARVAAGFFLDLETNTFNYYPVRSDMAHAWVEVCYPGYGWIEYDPTTQILAEGEEFRFSSGVSQELFERLMKEILDNHARLSPKEGLDSPAPGTFVSLREYVLRFLREYGVSLLIAFLAAACVLSHTRYLLGRILHRNPRKKAHFLWSYCKWRLRLGGYTRKAQETESEWTKRLDSHIPGVYDFYQGYAVARYAPAYSLEQFKDFKQDYKTFSRGYAKTLSLPRRIIAWVLHPLALLIGSPARKPPQSRGALGKAAGIAFLLFFAPRGDLMDAQNLGEELLNQDAQTLYSQALDAEIGEYWERAIELYTQGIRQYPQESRFPWALGNLYYHRELYGLAWDYYRQVEQLLPKDIDTLYQLSWTAAHLNNDALAAGYLERILDLDPDNKEAISNLGWIYYKLHRLAESRELLLAALERFGPDPDFAMTLGTIYTDLYRYEDAKKWYLEAISQGESLGNRGFTAVTRYNLSILEARFHHYDLAFEQTNASLRTQNRASGRLARGGLFLRRLDFTRALSDYQAAYEIDTAALSKLHLAQSYQLVGRLEEARLYGEDCLRGGDLSWMLNYRIDPVRYKGELHEILAKVYGGLAKTEGHIPAGTWQEGFRGLLRRISYRFKQEFHRQLFRKYCLLATNVYKTDHSAGGESNLDALNHYYRAFEAYPRRALTYLRKARDFEAPIIPASAPMYAYEEGRLLKDWALLQETLPRFDPVWERDMIAETYGELAQMRGAGPDEAIREAAVRLYGLNRGALRQQGIPLPAVMSIDVSQAVPPEKVSGIEKTLLWGIKAAGIDPDDSSPFTLRIRIMPQGLGYGAFCELSEGNQSLFSHTIPLRFFSKAEISVFARTLGDLVFVSE